MEQRLDLSYEDFYLGKKRRKISNPSEELKTRLENIKNVENTKTYKNSIELFEDLGI